MLRMILPTVNMLGKSHTKISKWLGGWGGDLPAYTKTDLPMGFECAQRAPVIYYLHFTRLNEWEMKISTFGFPLISHTISMGQYENFQTFSEPCTCVRETRPYNILQRSPQTQEIKHPEASFQK